MGIVNLLLEKKASLEEPCPGDELYHRPLHTAAQNGQLSIIELLLRRARCVTRIVLRRVAAIDLAGEWPSGSADHRLLSQVENEMLKLFDNHNV